MKVMLFCNGAANQRALAHRLGRVIDVSSIAVIQPGLERTDSFRQRVTMRLVGSPLRNAWRTLMAEYNRAYVDFPDVLVTHHVGVNSPSVLELVRTERPDLVLVSGTELLKKKLVSEIQKTGRVANLHTGISPYIKGGPNCTNWALAIGRIDLIGNTVMWLDTGIDSGNIIATERTPLTGRETLVELHIKVMDHAHDLYCRTVAAINCGLNVPSVPQAELGEGQLFLSRHWTASKALLAIFNFYKLFNERAVLKPPEELLVPLVSHCGSTQGTGKYLR